MSRPMGAWQLTKPSFTEQVIKSLNKLHPIECADQRWDNVGLLLGNADVPGVQQTPRVMVTVDLTFRVALEAIEKGASVIIAYHPIIFSGLKRINQDDAQQATLLALARANVAVYSPHTAVDATGLNAWLAQAAGAGDMDITATPDGENDISPGYGGIFRAKDGIPLADVAKRLAAALGGLSHVIIAAASGADPRSVMVRTLAVCAGSGYDVLASANVDLLITGEVSHHNALKILQSGRALLQVFHSHSERAYLQTVLAPRLETELRQTVPGAIVSPSQHDQDPLRIYEVDQL